MGAVKQISAIVVLGCGDATLSPDFSGYSPGVLAAFAA
jgi:hypothetical protein